MWIYIYLNKKYLLLCYFFLFEHVKGEHVVPQLPLSPAQCSTFSFSGSSMEELNSTSNISSPGQPHPVSWDSKLTTSVVLSLCFALRVPRNIAVIIIKPNWQHLSNLSQILMLILAMSDLLCLSTLPLWSYTILYTWTLGPVACKLVTCLVYCSVYVSLLTVTVSNATYRWCTCRGVHIRRKRGGCWFCGWLQ